MITAEQVAKMANKADHYVTPAGDWLSIRDCVPHAGWFEVEDEQGNQVYRINFKDVTLKGHEAFYALVKLKPQSFG
jgi:hypothetical protein